MYEACAIERVFATILACWMSSCLSSTSWTEAMLCRGGRAARDLGYVPTIVAAATATRDLPDGKGGVVPAATLQTASLAELADRTAWVVQKEQDIQE
jgi:hypothetical protein